MLKILYFCFDGLGERYVEYNDNICITRRYTEHIDFSPDLILSCGNWSRSLLNKFAAPVLFIDDTMLRAYKGFSCYSRGLLMDSEVGYDYANRPKEMDNHDIDTGRELLNYFYRIGSERKDKGKDSVVFCLQIPLDANLRAINSDHTVYMYDYFIKKVIKSIPKDVRIIIREHPLLELWSQRRWMAIKERVLEARASLGGFLKTTRRDFYLDRSSNIKDMIKKENIKCCFTLNSSSAFYFLANRIPVLTDIYSIYGEVLGLYRIDDLIKKNISFEKIIKTEMNLNNLYNFTGFYFRNYQIKNGINIMDFKHLITDAAFRNKIPIDLLSRI